MVRRYEEPIEVRAATGQAVPGEEPAPDAFVWRGRLYVVRTVLDHWKERRPWWRDALDERRVPAAAAAARSGSGAGPAGSSSGAAGSSAGADVLGDARERRVWRVEASAGRMAGTGVYDLGVDAVPGRWRLLRVAD